MRIETVTSRLRTDSRRRLFRGRGHHRRRGRDNPKSSGVKPGVARHWRTAPALGGLGGTHLGDVSRRL